MRISLRNFPGLQHCHRAGLVVALALSVLFGCGGSEEKDAAARKADEQDKVLARVDGSPITQYDLSLSMQSTLGAASTQMLDADGRQKLLESLVAARAIGLAQEKQLTPEEKKVLEKKTSAYREQLLVKMYLSQNTPAEPVTQEMVQAYYDGHQEQFGARTVRTYEMISTQGALNDEARDKLLAALSTPCKIADWPAEAERLKKNQLPVAYRKAASDAGILEQGLRDIVGKLKKGQCSEPTIFNGSLYIVRVLDEQKIPARPLNEVSAEIRKILLPVQLKKAVKQASDQVLEKVKVEYEKE